MLAIETVIPFVIASIGLAIAPGPDNIFVLTQSITHGPRAGILVVLGLCTGLIAHTLAVTLGLAALFQNSVLAFTLLKRTGAAYLLFLAWQAFRAPTQDLSTFVVFGLIALLSGKLSSALKRSPKAQSRLNKLAGLIFITLALKILSSQL